MSKAMKPGATGWRAHRPTISARLAAFFDHSNSTLESSTMLNRAKGAGRAIALAALMMILLVAPAYAAGSGMPWEGPLEQIVDSITGPVARAAAVIAIVIAGIAIMFSEGGGGIRKLAFVGLGIAVMFAAVSFFLDFFGFAGGALI